MFPSAEVACPGLLVRRGLLPRRGPRRGHATNRTHCEGTRFDPHWRTRQARYTVSHGMPVETPRSTDLAVPQTLPLMKQTAVRQARSDAGRCVNPQPLSGPRYPQHRAAARISHRYTKCRSRWLELAPRRRGPRPEALPPERSGRLEHLVEVPFQEFPVRPVQPVFRQPDRCSGPGIELLTVAEFVAQSGADQQPESRVDTEIPRS